MDPASDSDASIEEEAAAWLARLRAPNGRTDQAAFETWYMADPRHADAYERLLASWEQLGVARDTDAGRQHRPFFIATLPGSGRHRVLTVAAAATVLVAATIGLSSLGLGPSPVVSAAYATSVGQIRTVALPDGSRVTLDTDTALHTAFSRRERRVRLEHGRARFRVAPDSRPFVVDAGAKALSITGTDLDIDLARGSTAIAVLHGEVQIMESSQPSAKPTVDVGSGRMVTITAKGDTGKVAKLAASDMRWPTGMLAFEDAPLADVVSRANLYATKKIVLADPALGKLRFTGSFRSIDIANLARMLAAMYRLDLGRDASGNLLLHATDKSPSE